MKMWQQGDVLLFAVDKLPAIAQRREDGVLAEGEVTGHAHVAEGLDVEVYEDDDGVLWMSAPNGATVTHEEHKPISLPEGSYRIGAVREYDYLREETRRVYD